MEKIRRAARQSTRSDCCSNSSRNREAGGWSLPDFFLTPYLDASRRHYDVQEFLQFRDRAFITIAYQALLKREPDYEGFENYLKILRDNPSKKKEILAAISISAEGKSHAVKVEGLWWEKCKVALQNTPFLGKGIRRLFMLFDNRPLKRKFAVLDDRLGHLAEETGQALNWITTQAEKRLGDKMDKKELEKKANVWDLNTKADKRELAKKVDVEDMERYLRSVGHVLDMVSELHKPLQEKKSAGEPMEGVDAYSGKWMDELYYSFEEAFRGSRLSLQRKMAVYLPELQEVTGRVFPLENAPELPADCAVLDLGCGRGEFLELLAKNGIQAIGIDENRLMVKHGQEAGLAVRQGDIFTFLAELPPACLAVVTAFHVIEHLPFERQLLLIDHARRVLAPGGMLLLETPNPCNILAGSVDFYRDPTHLRPIHPDTLLFLANARGFDRAGIFFLNDIEDVGPVLEDAANMRFTDLQDYVRVSRDYALIAYKV